MGYIAHHAIIVTARSESDATKAQDFALSLSLICSDVEPSKINGYHSFMIIPDGSKEGWQASADGDAARASWCKWAREARKQHLYLDWVLVRFGGDEPDRACVEDHSERDAE